MMRRLGNPKNLGLVRGRLCESADRGEAPDKPAAIPDRYPKGIIVDPGGGQGREVIGGQLDYALVFAPVVVRMFETARGLDAESQVPETPGNLQRAGARHERLVQLAEQRVGACQDSADPPSPAVVVQPLGEALGLAQTLQPPPNFTEHAQHRL